LAVVFGLVMAAGLCIAVAQADTEVCSCPNVGEVNGYQPIDIADMAKLITIAFNGAPRETDPNCPNPRADFNADGSIDVRDVVAINDFLFTGLPLPVNPCDCAAHPSWCTPMVDPNPGAPGNSVVVESKTVIQGQQDVPIHVKLTNDVSLRTIVLPLVVRSITPGAFITSVQCTRSERLNSETLADFKSFNCYAEPGGTCGAGGFGMPTSTYAGLGPSPVRAVASSPEGLLFVAGQTTMPGMVPGADVGGSIVLTVDVTGAPGELEIDTACVDPSNHLIFIQDDLPTSTPIVPAFTKGIISIVANSAPLAQCQDLILDAGANCMANGSVDNGSYDPNGGSVTVTETPSGPYSLGVTPVTLVVTDNGGAADTCVATVTVVDRTPPVLSCPTSMPTGISPSDTGTNVNYNVTATDNCPGTTIVCTPPSGSYFAPGVTPVVCVATDAAGLADTCSFSVIVFSQCFDRLSDANCDGITDLVDVVTVINIAFRGGHQVPPCAGIAK
jgi:hypothetical protein